ncbi:hypothetical protein Tco_0599520 [Tanacetum coccineum]
MKETPSSYANKLIPTSSTKANLWKLEANVPNGTDYDVWLPLASVHEQWVVLLLLRVRKRRDTVILDKINVLEKHILEGKLVLVDDGKPLENVDYSVNLGRDDEAEPVEN